MTPLTDKQGIRARARAARRSAQQDDAGLDIAAHFLGSLDALGLDPSRDVVAGYWPLDSEADTRPLLHELHGRGFSCALPVVVTRDAALIFRIWRPDMPLEEGLMKSLEPGPEAPRTSPTVVLTPLVAYDRRGGRLGFGGGYYDRTLAELRKEKGILAVGVALSVQEVDELPREAHDQALDWVVTEEGMIRMGSA